MKLVNETSAGSFCRRGMVPLTSLNPKAVIADTNCCRLFSPTFQVCGCHSQKIQINSPDLSLALLRTLLYIADVLKAVAAGFHSDFYIFKKNPALEKEYI